MKIWDSVYISVVEKICSFWYVLQVFNMPDFFIHMQSTYGDLWFPESRLKLAMFNFSDILVKKSGSARSSFTWKSSTTLNGTNSGSMPSLFARNSHTCTRRRSSITKSWAASWKKRRPCSRKWSRVLKKGWGSSPNTSGSGFMENHLLFFSGWI